MGADEERGRVGEPRSTSVRVAAAHTGSPSGAAAQSGSATCTGWWIMSPPISASWPFELIRTLTWPGVCPGVGTRVTSLR